jgi:predicted nucleic acid-binding protein
MSGVFLDSNIILYVLSADANKADRAEALLRQRPSISVQVLNEVTSVCRRKLQMSWVETHALLNAVKACCQVHPLTVETHATACQLAEQHQLSFYDASILAAALQCSCQTLMSEDMHHGAKIQGLEICNPFVAAA